MKEYIEERVLEIAGYIVENRATVRQAAREYRVSKSTVHKDVTQRLYEIDPLFAAEVRAVLAYNRGGEATRQKYAHRRGAGMK